MRCGTSAVEVMVAVMVVAAVGIPLMTLLFAERDTEQRSRYEYAALLATRDEMYQTRMLVAIGAVPESIAHDFRPLAGSPLDSLGPAFIGAKGGPVYNAEQARVATQLTINPPAPGPTQRLQIANLAARWVDPQANATRPGGARKSSVDTVFGVLRPPVP